MKATQNNSVTASRHSLGTTLGGVAHPKWFVQAIQLVRRVVGHAAAAIGFILREASPFAVPSHGFQPENGTLCGAHWNRAYLAGGANA